MDATGNVCAHETDTKAILAGIQDRIGPQRFDAWFRHGTCLSIEDGRVKVGAANPFIAGWIEKHFAEDILAAVRAVAGGAPSLFVGVDPELSGRLRKRQLDVQAVLVARGTGGTARGRQPASAPGTARYRLEDFVVGPSNRLAHSAAAQMADDAPPEYNPLFLHGPCGVGKTHLLQGICRAVAEQSGPTRCRYVTAEAFTNEFVQAIRRKKVEQFRATYRPLELLAIDDVHFLAAKKATQEEFLHTFNTIQSAGRRVVMASDAHPRMLGQLAEQLVSRFLSGMVVRIDPPDRATRVEILNRIAARMRLSAEAEALDYVAIHIRGSVRELEGALVKLAALAELGKEPITLKLAREGLSEHLAQADSAVTLGDIETVASAYFGMTPADLHSSRRTHAVSLARGFVMHLARRHTRMSYPEIGRFMGKNHSSVVLAVQRVEKMLSENASCRWMAPAGPKTVTAKELMETLNEQIS